MRPGVASGRHVLECNHCNKRKVDIFSGRSIPIREWSFIPFFSLPSHSPQRSTARASPHCLRLIQRMIGPAAEERLGAYGVSIHNHRQHREKRTPMVSRPVRQRPEMRSLGFLRFQTGGFHRAERRNRFCETSPRSCL